MKFMTSLILGCCFIAVYIGFNIIGLGLTAALFGILGAIMLMFSIYHTCCDIWRDDGKA